MRRSSSWDSGPVLPMFAPKPAESARPVSNASEQEGTDPAVRRMKDEGFEIVRPKETESLPWNPEAFESAFGAFDREYEDTDGSGDKFRTQNLIKTHRESLLVAAKGHPLYEELERALNGTITSPIFGVCYKIRDNPIETKTATAS